MIKYPSLLMNNTNDSQPSQKQPVNNEISGLHVPIIMPQKMNLRLDQKNRTSSELRVESLQKNKQRKPSNDSSGLITSSLDNHLLSSKSIECSGLEQNRFKSTTSDKESYRLK